MSMRSTAMSVSGSVPTSWAMASRPSASRTSISCAPAITWWLVSRKPCGETITPEPMPTEAVSPFPRPPKMWGAQGLSAWGERARARCVVTLTTAGSAAAAAARKLPAAAAEAALAAPVASNTGTVGSGPRPRSQSGLSVDTTNSAATATVTAWAKMSQSLRIDLDSTMPRARPAPRTRRRLPAGCSPAGSRRRGAVDYRPVPGGTRPGAHQ